MPTTDCEEALASTFHTPPSPGSPQHTQAALRGAAQQVLEVLDHWDLSDASRAALLGLAPHRLEAHRKGQALPCDEQCLQRAVLILEIDGLLRRLHPESEDCRRMWLTTPSEAFGGQTPLAMTERHGLAGLQALRGLLLHRFCS